MQYNVWAGTARLSTITLCCRKEMVYYKSQYFFIFLKSHYFSFLSQNWTQICLSSAKILPFKLGLNYALSCKYCAISLYDCDTVDCGNKIRQQLKLKVYPISTFKLWTKHMKIVKLIQVSISTNIYQEALRKKKKKRILEIWVLTVWYFTNAALILTE